jgi:GR25 family glycosyltransferase involved in LPS biosynthesis
MDKYNIPNIFHFIYDSEFINIDTNFDIEIYIYFSIKSIIEIYNPELIYFYYINLPNGKLWNNIKNNLKLKKLKLPSKYSNNVNLFFNKYKNSIIYKNLFDNGGIYIDKYTLLIKPINNLFSYNFIKSKNNEIICSEKNSNIIKKYIDLCYNNKKIFEENKLLYDLNYDNSYENIYNIIFKEITDYSYGDYFHIIKECFLINIKNNKDNLNNIYLYDIFNKITIYNLLIRYVLTYKIVNNEISYNSLNNSNNHNLSLINNIDKIYWINLEKSIYRKSKMIQILNNFNIKNIRINAYDGGIEENISETYFYSESNIFPNYSNKEYAILLSHLTAIETYSNSYDNKYGIALICEDDLSLDFINYWDKDIKTIIDNAPEDWDILMLGYFSVNLNRENLYEKWNNEWSAISYLVNYKTIKKINNLKLNKKWICNENDLMVSDNYIFSKFNTYVYKYPYFTFPNNNSSTFHEDHLDYHKIYKISNYITLENIYNLYCN